jgi:hypothetical protein
VVTRVILRGEPIPQPCEIPKASRRTTRCETAWRLAGLERERLRSRRKDPGVPADRSACGRDEKAREGMKGRESDPSPLWTRNLGAEKPMEANGAATRLVPGPADELRVVCESLEGRPHL